MAEQKNPLREWRGERTQDEAAMIIGCERLTYVALEASPIRFRITSDNVLHIQAVTKIPLVTLIDYFEQKEMAK